MARLRNRILKADYYSDPELLRWPRDKRETYRGLWAIAEDSGCLEDDPWGWKLLIWPSPMDADITTERLEEWRDEMVEAGKLVPYEAEGKRYLWIRNFHRHELPPNPQRPDLPLPPWITCEATQHNRGNGRVTRCRYHLDTIALSQRDDRAMTDQLPPYRTVPNHTDTFGGPTDAGPPGETGENYGNLGKTITEVAPASEDVLPTSHGFDTVDDNQPVEDPDNRTEGQRLVACYIDEKVKRGRSKPTRQQIGIVARIIGEKLEGGAKYDVLYKAIVHLVEHARPTTAFPAIIDEIEAALARQPGPGPEKEPELTQEEREASLLAMREAKERMQAMGAGIGRPV